MSKPFWTTAQGKKIPISELENDHLKGILQYFYFIAVEMKHSEMINLQLEIALEPSKRDECVAAIEIIKKMPIEDYTNRLPGWNSVVTEYLRRGCCHEIDLDHFEYQKN